MAKQHRYLVCPACGRPGLAETVFARARAFSALVKTVGGRGMLTWARDLPATAVERAKAINALRAALRRMGASEEG